MRRTNPDERMRELERRARLGDAEARAEYEAQLRRSGTIGQLQTEEADRQEMLARASHHRLLLPGARRWRDVFADEAPWRIRYDLVFIPPELHTTTFGKVRDWIRANADTLGVPRDGEIGVSPDLTAASVTVRPPEPNWAEPWKITDVVHSRGKRRTVTCSIPIGPFCQVTARSSARERQSMYVRAQPRVYELIKADMIAAGCNDSISFEVVIRGEGEPHTALVLARNNTILASRWIAILPELEVPVL